MYFVSSGTLISAHSLTTERETKNSKATRQNPTSLTWFISQTSCDNSWTPIITWCVIILCNKQIISDQFCSTAMLTLFAQGRVKPQICTIFYLDTAPPIRTVFFNVAADELTSPNGGKFHWTKLCIIV